MFSIRRSHTNHFQRSRGVFTCIKRQGVFTNLFWTMIPSYTYAGFKRVHTSFLENVFVKYTSHFIYED